MDREVREQFRALRDDNRLLRAELRGDILGLHTKLDEHIRATNERCARRGEELAVLMNRERERDRRVDRRIAFGLFLIAAASLALKLLP